MNDSKANVETVSVVIPCYNEANFIGKVLENLAEQYDKEHYELVVVDGFSDDSTRDVIRNFQRVRPDLTVKLIENPARVIPVALNLGIAAARGEIIARMDAHAIPSVGYIKRCVTVLGKTTTGAVGMPCTVRPGSNTLIARAIAGAVSHPFGIGDAKYRLGAAGPLQEPVDTVAFACFRKSVWQELGGYNESLLTNEDYDFNYRVRRSGREVILDRSGHCEYFARTTLSALASQYSRYGGWKAEMIRMQPRSIKVRHLVAPLFIVSVLALGILGLAWRPAWWLLILQLAAYLVCALFAGWQISRKSKDGLAILIVSPLIFLIIHSTWGASFLLRFLRPRIPGRNSEV